MDFLRRCWAEINLDNVKYNYEQYKKHLGGDTQIMCVVKASCYGHEDDIIVPYLQKELGVRHFAVSNIMEAERLRTMGVTGEILILGYTPPEYADELVKYNIIQACTEFSYAEKLSIACTDGEVRIHSAVDTGMTRIGFHGTVDEISTEIARTAKLHGVSLEGIFTHYAVADCDDESSCDYTKEQTDKFFAVEEALKKQGIRLKVAHCLNSAGGMYHYDSRSSFARLGIILYGLYPNPELSLPFKPKPVMTLKAVVSQVKYIEKDTTVSYGRTYTAPERVKLATVTAGYADGYPRGLSNKGEVIIHGQKCRITGRVCMDQFMCDVSHLDDVKSGDEVILIGEDGESRITADDIGRQTGTIGYEIVCGVSARVPRTVG
jgi:alanine racemase